MTPSLTLRMTLPPVVNQEIGPLPARTGAPTTPPVNTCVHGVVAAVGGAPHAGVRAEEPVLVVEHERVPDGPDPRQE